MKKFRRSFSLILILFIGMLQEGLLSGQVIVTTPVFPLENDSVTIIFDAAQGNGELMNVSPPIYAHTGVITNLSSSPSDWKYVVAGWNENIPKALMTPLGGNKYRLKIQPSIRSYYGVPVNEQIEKMAFVFRNSDGTKVGRNADGSDIFADVYPPVMSVNIVEPTNRDLYLYQQDTILVSAVSPLAASLKIFINGNLVKTSPGQFIYDTILADNFGQNWVKNQIRIMAENDTASASDSVSYTVIPTPAVADLPLGMIDGINYLDTTSALLCLYAPYKKNVFLMGEFNNWQLDSNFYMKVTPDGKRYWLQINNLIPKEEYIFQYLVDGNIRIGDPYADKVSDPDDQYISSATYPELKPYPTGLTTGVATYLQTDQDPYPWDPEPFVAPPVSSLIIYELLIRDFTLAHDYPSLIDTLDYLKNSGINAIELMPIMEFEGNISWGYNPDYSFAVDKYYGTKNGLKQFVEAAHAKGIAVILDIVCNHHFGNSPLVKLYWDGNAQCPAANNPWFNQIPKHPYNVGYDFNHESPDTRVYMERLITYWLTEFHVDGYRFDLSKGFTQKNSYPNNVALWGQYDASRISILENYESVIHAVNPDAYMILEHFADNSEEVVLSNNNMLLWGNVTGVYEEAAMGYNENSKSDLSWASYKKRGWTQPNLVAYMESHDEERMMFKAITYGNITQTDYKIKGDTSLCLKRDELAANFYFMLPGPKMVWQFGELGYDYSINYPTGTSDSRLTPKPIRWDYLTQWRRRYTRNVFAALMELKKNQPVFSTTDYTIDVTGATKRIWLRHSAMDATVLGNFDVVSKNVDPSFTKTGTWYEYYSGDSLIVTDVSATLPFKPGEYRIYTTARLQKPIFTGLDEHPLPGSVETGKALVYPNPATDLVNFAFNITEPGKARIMLYDISGRLVKQFFTGLLSQGLHQYTIDLTATTGEHISPGVYLYVFQAGKIQSQGKLIIQ
ncbi:MAG: alpha-amylase family glycosyl hydrolase [Bacteroidales bacterium]|nr:alpha-amylase family glycosyl hydrolase [Bacteroidales bacterium]